MLWLEVGLESADGECGVRGTGGGGGTRIVGGGGMWLESRDFGREDGGGLRWATRRPGGKEETGREFPPTPDPEV